jgi:hypothetical protein
MALAPRAAPAELATQTPRDAMAERGHQQTDGEPRAADDIDEILSRANPNPDRVGCPPRETLVGLARRAQPIGDPAYEHLVKCSPCYREFRALQGELSGVDGTTTSSRRRVLAWVAFAAVLVIAAGGTWRALYAPGTTAPTTVSSQAAQLRAEVDLRRFATTRGERDPEAAAPVSLPRGVVDVTLLLPVGSEPGAYEIQLLDSELKSRASAQATGVIRDFVTTVRSTIDLRTVQSGTYQLAVRRSGDDWRLFPASVK